MIPGSFGDLPTLLGGQVATDLRFGAFWIPVHAKVATAEDFFGTCGIRTYSVLVS